MDTAASTALPPRRSTSIPIAEASGSTLDTAPPVPTASAALGGALGCAATGGASSTPTIASTSAATIPVTRRTAASSRHNILTQPSDAPYGGHSHTFARGQASPGDGGSCRGRPRQLPPRG